MRDWEEYVTLLSWNSDQLNGFIHVRFVSKRPLSSLSPLLTETTVVEILWYWYSTGRRCTISHHQVPVLYCSGISAGNCAKPVGKLGSKMKEQHLNFSFKSDYYCNQEPARDLIFCTWNNLKFWANFGFIGYLARTSIITNTTMASSWFASSMWEEFGEIRVLWF